MINNVRSIESLLDQVQTIVKHYDKIAEERGDKFNVFDIVGLKNDEVRMHSKFIGNLLNPRGSHGMKDIFLNLFIEIVNKKLLIDGNPNDYVFKFLPFKEIKPNIIERHTDFVSEDRKEGGRIDIILEDSSQVLIIENKIFAGNQQNQLVRYTNEAKRLGKPYFVLYLTLEGKEMPYEEVDEINGNCYNYNCLKFPKLDIKTEDESKVKNISHYLPISYKEELLAWLNLCIKETYDKPLLREGVKHYINLIKQLSKQTMDVNLEEEVMSLLSNKERYNTAKIISQALEGFRFKNLELFWTELEEKVSRELELVKDIQIIQDNYHTNNGKINTKELGSWIGVAFRIPDSNLSIIFGNDADGFNYGVFYIASGIPENFDQLEKSIQNSLEEILKNDLKNNYPDRNFRKSYGDFNLIYLGEDPRSYEMILEKPREEFIDSIIKELKVLVPKLKELKI